MRHGQRVAWLASRRIPKLRRHTTNTLVSFAQLAASLLAIRPLSSTSHLVALPRGQRAGAGHDRVEAGAAGARGAGAEIVGRGEGEHDETLGAVAAAEKAATAGDGPAVLRHLAGAGKWALGVAEKIGTAVAVEAIKRAMTGG